MMQKLKTDAKNKHKFLQMKLMWKKVAPDVTRPKTPKVRDIYRKQIKEAEDKLEKGDLSPNERKQLKEFADLEFDEWEEEQGRQMINNMLKYKDMTLEQQRLMPHMVFLKSIAPTMSMAQQQPKVEIPSLLPTEDIETRVKRKEVRQNELRNLYKNMYKKNKRKMDR